MTSIRIQERTSFDDLLKWRLPACEVLRISKRSSFEPGAQGFALSMLASLRPGPSSPVIECDFEEPTTLEELESTLLGSAYGFALARFTSKISFVGGTASARLKPLLAEYYRANDGILGLGNCRSIVCPDPVFSLPPALPMEGNGDPTEQLAPEKFPLPSSFAALLNKVVKTMGFTRALESTEESQIISFVYEALRNSWEHGLPSDRTRRARSTRALIIEKIVLKNRDVAERNLSVGLKQYLARIVDANKQSLGLGVVCLTVADQGDGIQSTLPKKSEYEHETPEERLARAFLPGESRKPTSAVRRGLGLPNVVTAAHNLQAQLRLTSGDLTAVQDFSFAEEKYPSFKFNQIQSMPSQLSCGTSVSIFVPEFALNRDQRNLFAD